MEINVLYREMVIMMVSIRPSQNTFLYLAYIGHKGCCQGQVITGADRGNKKIMKGKE